MYLRRFLFTLFAVALSIPAFGQSLAKTFTLTAANQCASIGTSQLPTVGIDVSGTFSLTLTPYVVINGQTKRASQVTPSSSNTAQATITTAGGYTDPFVGGYDTFLLCVTSYSSGSVVIWLNPSPALNGSLLGGGGGAGVSSFNARTGAVVSVADDYAAVAGLDLGDGTSLIDFDTVDGILGFGDQPTSPDPGSDDDCVFGPYATGASSNGIVCTGANGSVLSVDNADDALPTGISLTTGTTGVILEQAGANDSQQSTNGWYSSGILTSDMHGLSVRCASVGSAANPSVVNCQSGAAPLGFAGGAFSCATNASGGTCVVDTARVCADSGGCTNSLQAISTIFVSQVSDEGGILGVTCNTTPTSAMVSARSDGVSFTITLGTFAVNPLCFNFEIN